MPSETKLEKPIIEEPCIVQSESKLIQDTTLVSNEPIPFHAKQEISLPDRAFAQPMMEQEISVPNRTILGKLKTYTKQRKILGSKLVRRVISANTNLICRPPSKPPDKQNSLEGEINKKISPYMNPICRPPPKPPNMKSTGEKKLWYYTPLQNPLQKLLMWPGYQR